MRVKFNCLLLLYFLFISTFSGCSGRDSPGPTQAQKTALNQSIVTDFVNKYHSSDNQEDRDGITKQLKDSGEEAISLLINFIKIPEVLETRAAGLDLLVSLIDSAKQAQFLTPFLLEMLTSNDVKQRINSTYVLSGLIGWFSRFSWKELIDALSDDEYRVRINAAQTLGKIVGDTGEHSEEIISALKQKLSDENESVQFEVIGAFGKCGEHAQEAISDLVKIYPELEIENKRITVWSLGKIGSETDHNIKASFETILSGVKQDEDEELQWFSMFALEDMRKKLGRELSQIAFDTLTEILKNGKYEKNKERARTAYDKIALHWTDNHAADIDLPLGAHLEGDLFRGFFAANTVAKLLTLIKKNGGVRVVAVMNGTGTRTAVTVPEDYWVTEEQEEILNTFLDENERSGGRLRGMYVDKGTREWGPDVSTIIITRDTDLHTLRHEYLHHLLSSILKNGFYSPFHEKKLCLAEFMKEEDTYYDRLQEAIKLGPSFDKSTPEQRQTVCKAYIDYHIARALQFLSVKQQEIIIDQLFIGHQSEFNESNENIFTAYWSIITDLNEIKLYLESEKFKSQFDPAFQFIQQYGSQHDKEEVSRKKEMLKATFDAVLESLADISNEVQDWHDTNFMVGADRYATLGDINFENRVNEADVAIIEALLNDPSFTVTEGQEERSDVDGDGEITQYDLQWVKNIMGHHKHSSDDISFSIAEKAKNLGYDLDFGDTVKPYNSALWASCSDHFYLSLLLDDPRSHNKSITKILLTYDETSYDAKSKLLKVNLQGNNSELIRLILSLK